MIYSQSPSLTGSQSASQPVTKAVQAQNVLLRGAKLKNTDYIFGNYSSYRLQTRWRWLVLVEKGGMVRLPVGCSSYWETLHYR